DEVVSFSNSKNPAPLPGIVESTPFLRKSTPPLNVWVPTNFENEPLAPIDFQLISVGAIAPNVRPSLSYPRLPPWGHLLTVIWLRYGGENPSGDGANPIVSVLLSGNRVIPNRSAITELSLRTHVLLIARIFGRRTRM